MKTVNRILLTSALLLLGFGTAMAQDFQTGYFLGSYQYAYRMNPAFQSERGFVSLGLGQTGLTATSNLGLDNFLFVKDGKTCLFLNDKVSSKEFLGQLSKTENNLAVDLNLNILAVGFWVERCFCTLDLNVRSSESVSLPYDLFRFLKDGTTGGTAFNLAGTGVRSKSYVELATGWSRNWNNFISGGARLKFLVGIAEAQAYMNKLDLVMDKNQWNITAQGSLDMSSPLLKMGTKPDGSYDFSTIGLNPVSKAGPAGFGGALDLGISVNIFPWFTASFALLDFGFMAWNRELTGKTSEATYTWNPSTSEAVDVMGGGSNPMQGELDKMKEALENIYKFNPTSSRGAVTELLPYRMNLGAELRLPWWDRVSLGILYSHRGGKGFKWDEGRISLNVSPLNWLSLSGSTAFNDFFKSFGFGFNLHPGVINLFFGADVIPGRVIPLSSISDNLSMLPSFLGVPTSNMNINGYFGLSIAFGKRKLTHKRFLRMELFEDKEQ